MHVSHGVHEIGAWGTTISLIILIGAIIYRGFKQLPARRQKRLLQASAVGLVVLLGGYWFIARPYYARKNCNIVALNYLSTHPFAAENAYATADAVCLNSKGL